MKRPAFVPATSGLTLPGGGSGPDTSRETTVPLMAGDTNVHVLPPSALSYRGGPAAAVDVSLPATKCTGACTPATPSAPMIVYARPDCPHVEPPSRPTIPSHLHTA